MSRGRREASLGVFRHWILEKVVLAITAVAHLADLADLTVFLFFFIFKKKLKK
ncbi:hypothetical protein N9S81_00040 [bacterium]|nr:hypothetical protein [bacterium]